MKFADSMITKTRRRYTEEFKDKGVRLVRDLARLVAQVARDLGIADHYYNRWRAEVARAREALIYSLLAMCYRERHTQG